VFCIRLIEVRDVVRGGRNNKGAISTNHMVATRRHVTFATTMGDG